MPSPKRTRTRPPSSRTERPTRSAPRPALILAAIGVPVVAAAIIASFVFGGSPPATGGVPGVSPSAAGSAQPSGAGSITDRLVRADSPTRGPADAPVTLVEFLDPECEACRAAYPEVERLLAEFEGRVRYVVRYVPGHANSALAVVALQTAAAQDAYWEMLGLLFERQPEWGEQQEPQTEAFLRYAAELGLDTDPFAAAFAQPDVATVDRDLQDAIAVGVQGTPTFFVNGTMVDLPGLEAAVEAALVNR